jgi:hypothetical protein
MDANNRATASKKLLWVAWAMIVPPVLMLLMSAVMKLAKTQQVVEGFSKMGYPSSSPLVIGGVELLCTVLYLVPQTSVLGAILLTGYLGGAIDASVRQGASFVLPLIFGILLWGGLFLRDPRVRTLIPLRSSPKPA